MYVLYKCTPFSIDSEGWQVGKLYVMIRTEGISTSRKTEGPYLRKKVQLRGYIRGWKLTVLDMLEADLIFSDTFRGITNRIFQDTGLSIWFSSSIVLQTGRKLRCYGLSIWISSFIVLQTGRKLRCYALPCPLLLIIKYLPDRIYFWTYIRMRLKNFEDPTSNRENWPRRESLIKVSEIRPQLETLLLSLVTTKLKWIV